jgi:hypothetical protein
VGSKGLLIAFRIVAGLFAAFVGVTSILFAFTSLSAEEAPHRFHNLGAFPAYVLLSAVPLAIVAWRPDQVIALRVAWAVAVATTVTSIMGEDFVSGLFVINPVVLVVLTILYPRRAELWPSGSPSFALAALSILGGIPAAIYAWDNARIQPLGDPANDPTGHWELHHWSGIGGAALALVLVGLVLSFRSAGDRMWMRLAGLSAALFGVAALAFDGKPSAPATGWAVVVLLGGVAYAAVAEVTAREEVAVA